MRRIEERFKRLRAEQKRGFIPFITAGDPDLETTSALIVELANAGADVIELGLPFTDPVADGPVIQRASERALRQRIGVSEALSVVAQARRATDVPIVLFSYFNPLLQFGIEHLAEAAKVAGVDGVLVTDLVPEEAGDVVSILNRHELDQIFLAAPTSTDARLQMIAERASGFIYAISRAGVTGTRTELSAEAERLVARIRRISDLPVAIGFGISNSEHVVEVWRYADAAVVGSAIVAEIERSNGSPDIVERIGEFTRSLLPK